MLSPKSDLVMLNATEKEKKPNKLYNHHECDVRTIKSKRSFTNNNKNQPQMFHRGLVLSRRG